MILLLDTSALIDGRVEKLMATGISGAQIFILDCVLKELKTMADVGNEAVRDKGRRGLECAERMLQNAELSIQALLTGNQQPVDEALVAMGATMGGKIVTGDWALIAHAKASGVRCVSLFGMAEAMRQSVDVGSMIELDITGRGTKRGQVTGQLPDGMHIVLEGEESMIGERIVCEITNIIRTENGHMAFAKKAGVG